MAHPDATVLAGATDVGLWVTKQMRRLGTVIHVGRVAELARIHESADGMEIGAGVSYTDAMETIAVHYPDFAEGYQVRYSRVGCKACQAPSRSRCNSSSL